MAASIERPWRLDSRIELVNEPRRGERRSLRNDNCCLAGQHSGLCGPRKKKSRLFSKTLSSPVVLFADLFFTDLCGFRFAEERRTFADMWTSLDTFSFRAACAQKCLWLQFWAFFYTSLWLARTVWPVFPAVLLPFFFFDFLCTDRQVSARKSHRACCTAILACIHVNGPDGRLIQPRITIHVTFARFSQCSDDGVLCITLKLAWIEWPGRELSSDTSIVFVGLGVAEIDPSNQIVGSFVQSLGSFVQSVGSFVQTAWSSFPSFAAAFFSHFSAWVMIFFVPCQSTLHWDVNIT